MEKEKHKTMRKEDVEWHKTPWGEGCDGERGHYECLSCDSKDKVGGELV